MTNFIFLLLKISRGNSPINELVYGINKSTKKLRVLVNEEDVMGIEKEGMGFGR